MDILNEIHVDTLISLSFMSSCSLSGSEHCLYAFVILGEESITEKGMMLVDVTYPHL
jgi:hypothetical protein